MKIEAAVSREGAPFPRIETVDIESPRAGEVLVRMVASGICHTDLGAHAGGAGGGLTPKPIVLGHEGAGIVAAVGDGVTTLKPGDHVVMSGNSCGVCPSCRRNYPSYCQEVMPRNFGGLRPDGSSALSQSGERIFAQFFGQSSFARYAVAPERTAVKIPDDVPLEVVAPLGCGVITGAGAVINSLHVGAGDSIAIFGVGGVGLSAVMAARIVGATRIVAVDVNPARLALAVELGATDAVNPKDGDPAKAIKEITRYGVNYSFNTTQAPEIWTAALDCLTMRGVAGFVTAPRGAWAPPLFPMLASGKSLKGILGGDAAPQIFIPMLIDYYRQGRLPLERLIKFYAFEDIAAAFKDTGAGETVKPVLRMSQ
jgi:aryl-alcohol dehydrogenase